MEHGNHSSGDAPGIHNQENGQAPPRQGSQQEMGPSSVQFFTAPSAPYSALPMQFSALGQNVPLPQVSSLVQPYFMQTAGLGVSKADEPHGSVRVSGSQLNPLGLAVRVSGSQAVPSSQLSPLAMGIHVSTSQDVHTSHLGTVGVPDSRMLQAMPVVQAMVSSGVYHSPPAYYERPSTDPNVFQGAATPWVEQVPSYQISSNSSQAVSSTKPQPPVPKQSEDQQACETRKLKSPMQVSVCLPPSANITTTSSTSIMPHPKRRLLEKLEAAVAFLENQERLSANQEKEGKQTAQLPKNLSSSGDTPGLAASTDENSETAESATLSEKSSDVSKQKENSHGTSSSKPTNQTHEPGQLKVAETAEAPRNHDVSLENEEVAQESEESPGAGDLDTTAEGENSEPVVFTQVQVKSESAEEIDDGYNDDSLVDEAAEKSDDPDYTPRDYIEIVPDQRRHTRSSCKESWRVRKWQKHWPQKYPWVLYDEVKNVMFCHLCLKHKPKSKTTFIKGNRVFKLEVLKSHSNSKDHKNAFKLHERKKKCDCMPTPVQKLSDKHKFFLQKVLEHFPWLSCNLKDGCLTCDICVRQGDEHWVIRLDDDFKMEDIAAHRDTEEHRESEETEFTSWDKLFDSGLAKADTAVLELLADRESPYVSTAIKNERVSDQAEEEDDEWIPRRRKTNRPRKYIPAAPQLRPQEIPAPISIDPVKQTTPSDLMYSLLQISDSSSKINSDGKRSKLIVTGEDNNHTLNLTCENVHGQTCRIMGINPWVVESEILKAGKKVDNTPPSKKARKNNMAEETSQKVDIPKDKIDVPKFKYRLLPTIGEFKTTWLTEFSWLAYDEETNVMTCKICVKHQKKNSFCKGCRLFQRPYLQSHEKLKMHRIAEEQEKVAQNSGVSSPQAAPSKGTSIFKTVSEKPKSTQKNKPPDGAGETTTQAMIIASKEKGPQMQERSQQKSSSAVQCSDQQSPNKETPTKSDKPYKPDHMEDFAITQLLASTGLWTSTPGAASEKGEPSERIPKLTLRRSQDTEQLTGDSDSKKNQEPCDAGEEDSDNEATESDFSPKEETESPLFSEAAAASILSSLSAQLPNSSNHSYHPPVSASEQHPTPVSVSTTVPSATDNDHATPGEMMPYNDVEMQASMGSANTGHIGEHVEGQQVSITAGQVPFPVTMVSGESAYAVQVASTIAGSQTLPIVTESDIQPQHYYGARKKQDLVSNTMQSGYDLNEPLPASQLPMLNREQLNISQVSLQTPQNISTNSISTESEKESVKRNRTFQSHWRNAHPWLVYDEDQHAMFCKICIRYNLESTFTTGNKSFRLGTVKAHEGSILHQKAVQMEFMQGVSSTY